MNPERVIAPLGRRALRVTGSVALGAYTVLRADDPDGPPPAPGQFYMLSTARRWGGGGDGRPFLPRAFSVLRAAAGSHTLEFLLEAVGPGTARLCEVQVGEELLVVGPLGRGFRPPSGRTAILVGGGVGIAPLAILQDRLEPAARALLGFRDGPHAEAAELLRNVSVATDDGSVGHRGLVTDLLAAELDRRSEEGLPEAIVYACGPPLMLEAVRRACAQREVAAQLALESGMACGYGACFGCAVPTRQGLIRLCLEGPVLDAAELEAVPVH